MGHAEYAAQDNRPDFHLPPNGGGVGMAVGVGFELQRGMLLEALALKILNKQCMEFIYFLFSAFLMLSFQTLKIAIKNRKCRNY